MKKKSISLLVLILFLSSILLSACSEDSKASGGSKSITTLSFAYELPDDHPWGEGAKKFKEVVEEKTNGEVKIEIYGNGSLAGSGREIQEGAKIGTIDIGISSTPMSLMNPYQDLFSLPYIFSSRENAWEVLDGPIGDKVGEKLSAHNLTHLAYWEDGFRQITNSTRPITKIEDFKGLRIRVPESEVRIESFKALGSSPLPMAWSEVFTALQQGTIDGQENPLSVINSSSFYDVQKYLTISNHVYSPATLFINTSKWDSLSKEQKEIVLEAAKAGRDLNRQLNEEQDSELVKGLEEKGMEVTVIDENKPFQEATKSVWESVVNDIGGDAQEIVDEINKSQ
ncbi:TRAP transporter substrate-binding protein [Psychrobacillus soli]|uniref:TRAP transporter substrate-binding protein n=1 Tax=Psychrobacillus soli TaxID=1543965 RepID=A0A544T5M0_9BACI|nr:TRAP transporter substrate-binding protein [Psychrobacillus soli]TQR12727.1 TRAP transporter substrate-binding protein [Psychrobacillus soli]